jgi:serine/threonine protein kinase/beta-lactam-binding protein with PASTA domain
MAPTFSPDYMLAGHYRILELLGVGQTAEVYLAEDLSLQRRVVVKVLLPDLAAHEEIRRAFRDHIVRAATFSHPHLARVYDGGQEHGAIFLISEYLSGGSLEDVLSAGRRLSIDDGARLGRDVASALAYVHEQGFVIGSLSPSKLLFDEEGRVRVSDVALAGLAAGYRERMTLDDARYLSPEQAIGERAGAEADVYALALILFEAVTGSAAYEGTTPEAILRARLDTPLPVRLELGSLDMVLAQAAVPDPRLRLDAEQFSARLGAVVNDAAPLVVRAGKQELPLLAQFTPQEHRSSIGFRPPSADQIIGAPLDDAGFPRSPRGRMNIGGGGGSTPRGPVGRTPRFERGQYDIPRDPRRWGIIIAALVLVVVVIGAGAAWKSGLFSKSHTVPNLVGMTSAQASHAVTGDGYTLSVTQRVNSAKVPVGGIVTQSPAAGTSEKSGQTIDVSVSKGPVLVTMPKDLVGKSCAAVTAQLKALHVSATCPASYAIYSTTLHLNDVARVLYNKGVNPLAVPLGSVVTLSLSKGPQGGTTTITTATTTTTAPATTTTTTTAATATTTTTLAGQGPRAVPNVVGDDYAQAIAAFKRAVLYFSTTGPGAGTTKWTKVISESPAAGTMVPYKSTVTLNVQ